jgi:hypothetical protein
VAIPQPFNYRALAQPFETPIKMMPHIAERLMKSFTDLTQVQVFKIEQFQGLALNVRQILERTLQALEVDLRLNFALHIGVSH